MMDNCDQRTDSRRKELGSAGISPDAPLLLRFVLVVIVIVIVLIPIVIGVPAMAVFIPPAVGVLPTPRAGFGEFYAILRDLGTVPAVMLGSFVKLVVDVDDSLLAVVVRTNNARRREQKAGPEGNSHEGIANRLRW